MQGKVKWFNTTKGFGFITADDGTELFVHYTGIAGRGFKTLEEGQEVTFDLGNNGKGPIALNVKIVGRSYE